MGAPARSTTIHHPDCTQEIHPTVIAGCIIIKAEQVIPSLENSDEIDENSGSDPLGGTQKSAKYGGVLCF